MADHNVIPFQFETHTLSVLTDNRGNPWWIGAEVCEILELKNVSQALDRLDPDEKNTICLNDGMPGNPNTLIVNESGLYTLVLRSRKKSAKAFRRWVTHEVLPQIRKTGSYVPATSVPVVRNPDIQMIIDMAVRLDAARTLAEEAKAEAAYASANADRALHSQLFFTVAEYVYINKLQDQLPKSAYRACSQHLQDYCYDNKIPFRKTAVGGKAWDTEYSFLVNVYTEVLPGWLKRRFAQNTLRMLPTPLEV